MIESNEGMNNFVLLTSFEVLRTEHRNFTSIQTYFFNTLVLIGITESSHTGTEPKNLRRFLVSLFSYFRFSVLSGRFRFWTIPVPWTPLIETNVNGSPLTILAIFKTTSINLSGSPWHHLSTYSTYFITFECLFTNPNV